MTNKFNYRYDIKTRILYKEHFGIFYLNDIVNSWEYAITEKIIPNDVKGFLLDYTNAELHYINGDGQKIVNYFNENHLVFGSKSFAVVVSTPSNIILPMIVEEIPKTYFLKTFTTVTAAKNWLLSYS